jgi:GntR family transcriptional regulator/MocR family aminotransferase
MPKLKWKFALPFLALDRGSEVPLHEQLYFQIQAAIKDGRLRDGTRLPSSRELANDAGISRTVTLRAYERLSVEGYVESHSGSGTYVRTTSNNRRSPEPPISLSKWADRLRATERNDAPNRWFSEVPTQEEFPAFYTWMQLLRKHAKPQMLALKQDEVSGGVRSLRRAIVEHVATMRGISCSPDEVVITNGTEQALSWITRLVLDNGDAAMIEDPAPRAARIALESVSATIQPVPVDSEGLCLDQADPNARVLMVTPRRQDPLGMSLSRPRHHMLYEWAKKWKTLVIEDDTDAGTETEGYTPALKAIDTRGIVIYIGSFGWSMRWATPLGFIIAAAPIAEHLRNTYAAFGRSPSPLDQIALAEFITSGGYARHIHEMRRTFDARRDGLVAALRDGASPWVVATMPGATLQLVAWLAADLEDVKLSAMAAGNGVRALALTPLCIRSQQRPALILHYGGLPPEEAPAAVAALSHAFQEPRACGY